MINEKRQVWWQLLSIQAGGALCLPVIMAGQIAAQKYGWLAASIGVVLGNLLLLVIGLLLASLSTYRRQSTVEHAAFYLGNLGRLLFTFVMMLSMLGWFGIQVNVMSLSLTKLGSEVPSLLQNIGIGAIIGSILCFGMRTIKGLSYMSAPLMCLTLLYAACRAEGKVPSAALETWFGGITLVVGANIAAVIDLPTFLQHAKSLKDAKICIVLLYGLVVPGIECMGIYLSAVTQQESILEVLQSGRGPLWMLWINCFILLSGWTTNNANLYSAFASSYSLRIKLSPSARTLVLGAIGTLIACLNPLGHIEEVLEVFGILIMSMGVIMIAGYLIEIKWRCYETIDY